VPDSDRSRLPGPAVHPLRRTIRYWAARLAAGTITRGYLRFRLEGRELLPPGPAIYCFNHLSWVDPFALMAVLPYRPRLWFFGPKEEDMGMGGRNRLMFWTGTAIPYKPGKNDLLDATRRVGAVLASGSVVAIAGEGRIHVRETELLPISEGAAYFALRSGVPLVPIAINGTSWLRFGGHVRVRVGEPIPIAGRPTREAVAEATALLTAALGVLIADAPEVATPGRVGRWMTERFNDWPEGSRDDARAVSEAAGLPYSKTVDPSG
jgi:1-acyl-sn-glycerol-3-phosphate acyltransferase